ncbi:MAG: DUF285 domain-containing protein, partial [Acetatifactor sp.]|nr:DUF285 domain-containing protein [Acetatifactor sp.]
GKVTDMSRMFYGCSGLTNLDVSGLDIKSVTDMSDMFSGCSGVTKLKVFRNLQLEKVALPLAEMYDEKGSSYQWFPTGLAEGIYLYVEKGSNPPIVDPPVDTQKGLRVELVHPDKTYTYDGSAHKPEIVVYNGDRLLTEGTDYTVKYSNNVKAVTSATAKKKMPTITVTGKGRFTGKTDATFTIKQCSLNDVMISGLVKGSENTIMVASGTKASPVLVYNGMKLGAKDYSIDKANVRFMADTADKTIVISAKNNGNYKGELRLNVEVVPKENLKKITSVTVERETISYDGKEHTPASIIVKAGKDDITNVEDAYTIVYYGDKTTAGTQKFTVIGLGAYTGSVTKSYTIQPRKAALDVTNQLEKDGRVVCVFDGAGVTFNDKLIVKDREFNKVLEQGRDYKVTYSGNKKVGVEKAKYTITFMGNYKGNAAVKKSFTIEKAPLNNDTVTVSAIDKVYNKKGIYKSSVYVINKATGVALKSSDYKVEYCIDQEMNKPMNKQNQVELGTDDAAYGIVYVKVTGKGNYAETTYATGAFKVYRKKSDTQPDISKAKISFKYKDGQKQSKVEYTGEAVYPERIEIIISSTDTKILKPDENGNWDSDANFSVEFLNNVEKGKATVIIRAKDGSDYVGSKNAVFSVAPRNLGNLEDFWKNILGLL